MELFLKLLERFVVAHEKLASAQAQIALATPSVKAMQAKVDAEKTPEPDPGTLPETKAPTAAEKKAAAAKAKAEAEAKAKAEAEAKAKAEAEAKAEAKAEAGGDFEYETLRALIGQTVQTGAAGTEIVKAMLAAHGVKSAKEAPAEKWEAMYNDLQARLKTPAEDPEFA